MRQFFLLIIFLFAFNYVRAAVPPLEREISISSTNEKVTSVLLRVQTQAGIIFSYPSALLESVPAVTFQAKQKSVREILALILPPTIYYKPKGNYVILKEKFPEKNKTEVSGYVYDKSTQKKIPNVTVYDRKTLKSAITDDYGYYSLTVPSLTHSISVNKTDYKDTLLLIKDANRATLVNISMDPLSDSLKQSKTWQDKLDDFSRSTTVFLRKFKAYVNTVNIRDSIERDYQVSFIPFVGTNHKLSGNISNDFSFNILGGYSKGVNRFELGGLFNINKEDVKFAQIGGLFNVVGGNVQGVQIGGLFNLTGKSMTGIQVAGLWNNNHGNTYGITVAGLVNRNRKSMRGIQVAGIANSTADTLSGISIAGIYNGSRHQKNALQVAGLYNYTKGGSANVQIAGLFNYTGVLKGIQIAPFNFCDSASGLPIGFFSFVKRGVHQLELSGDEVFYTNLSFRTGAPAFYNVFTAGIDPVKKDSLWHIGYGIGSSFRVKNKMRSDVTLTLQHINYGNFNLSVNALYKLYWGLEYKFTDKFSIAGGPVLNLFMTDPYDRQNEAKYPSVGPYELFSATTPLDYKLKGWIGGKVALRFF